jgi:hypothetical protein
MSEQGEAPRQPAASSPSMKSPISETVVVTNEFVMRRAEALQRPGSRLGNSDRELRTRALLPGSLLPR